MKFIYLFLICFSFGFVSAGLNIGYDSDGSVSNVILEVPETPINYSLIPTVNNSIYWNGNPWSDTRWLNIDGSNANQDIDIGAYDFYANDGFFDYLNFSYFISNFGGGIDATGDPWYFSGSDWEFANSVDIDENLNVDGNISASNYFIGDSLLNSSHIIDHGTHSIKDTFNHIINRGVSETITVSLTGGLDVEWTAGEVYDASIENFVETNAGSGTLTSDQVNYLKYTGTSTLELATSSSTSDEILIASFASWDGTIAGYREVSLLDNSLSNTRKGLRIAFPNRIISGMSVSEDTDVTNSLDVSMDAGQMIKDGIEEMNPTAIDSRTLPLVRLFHSGGDWTNDTNAEIDTIQYDDGNNLANIPSNKWTKGYFIYAHNELGWIYPTTYYNTKAQAEAGALSPLPGGLALTPKLTTVVYQQGDTDFSNAEWQDVRPGISEESFNIVTNVGDLAGLSDDNFPQYLLTDGSRVPTGNFN